MDPGTVFPLTGTANHPGLNARIWGQFDLYALENPGYSDEDALREVETSADREWEIIEEGILKRMMNYYAANTCEYSLPHNALRDFEFEKPPFLVSFIESKNPHGSMEQVSLEYDGSENTIIANKGVKYSKFFYSSFYNAMFISMDIPNYFINIISDSISSESPINIAFGKRVHKFRLYKLNYVENFFFRCDF